MTWALIISLVISLYIPQSSILNDSQITKHIKKTVSDKDICEQVLNLYEIYKKENEKFKHKEEELNNKLKELNSNRAATTEQFNVVYQQYLDAKKPLDSVLTESLYKIRNLLTDSEWSSLAKATSNNQKKIKRQRKKQINKLNKSLERLNKGIVEGIKDSKKRTKAFIALDGFKKKLNKIQKKYDTIREKENSLTLKKDISKNDIAELQDDINKQWWNIFNLFSDSRSIILELTTEEEWDVIQKEIDNKKYNIR
jgi:DNA repair exonuclease SbcCD ATPase subunit